MSSTRQAAKRLVRMAVVGTTALGVGAAIAVISAGGAATASSLGASCITNAQGVTVCTVVSGPVPMSVRWQ
jgi:hypothetical protein